MRPTVLVFFFLFLLREFILKIIFKVCFTYYVWGSDLDKKIDMMLLVPLTGNNLILFLKVVIKINLNVSGV